MKKFYSIVMAIACFMSAQAQTNVIEINNLTVPADNFKDYTSLLGMFQVLGMNDDYQVLYTVSTFQMVGSYTMADMYSDYKPQVYVAAEDKVYSAEDADLTVTAINGGYNFDGHIMAEGKTFHINMSYVHEAETIEVEVADFSLTDLSMMGEQMIYMGSADNSTELMLLIYATALENGKTYTFVDMDASSSMLGYNGNFLGIADGSTFTYTESDEGKKYEATIVSTTGDVFHFVWVDDATGIGELKVTKATTVKRIVDGQVVIEKDGHMFNINGQMIK